MSGVAKAGSAFWRQAGMSYLEYLGIASGAVRNCLKEPAKSKAMGRGFYAYNKAVGSTGEKMPVSQGAAK